MKTQEVGNKYGRLLVLREAGSIPLKNGKNRRIVECVCDCGNVKTYTLAKIRHGHTASCGCLALDVRTKHGYVQKDRADPLKRKTYVCWQDIKARCYFEKSGNYADYGGRGISMHPEWRNSFESFLRDVGKAPGPDMSLDRIDNNGNYEPGNVRWATVEQQQNNRRNNVVLTFDGRTMTSTQWSRHLGWPQQTITARLRLGWSVEKTLSTPRTIDRTKGYRVIHNQSLQSTG